MSATIPIGAGANGPLGLFLRRANRHGMIAGATGTGKTVTLQTLAEGFSLAGVPVFLADVKGDLGGMARAMDVGSAKGAMFAERARALGFEHTPTAFPVGFWDVFGAGGTPVRATVSEMGPLLLSRLLELNETQAGVLDIVFRVADEGGLPIVDLKDLRAMLVEVAARSAELTVTYGNVAKASVGAVQRALLRLEAQGADAFFGEPALDLRDFIGRDAAGRGQVNILDATRLMEAPRLYATFLLWMVSELFEVLPEIGDPDKPVLVFFFDEAHLLFADAPKALLERIERVVRLVRSKGVGVYFVTQNPVDVPDSVAAQLGNRVQHALRAFTPKDAEAVRKAAGTFRANPGVDVASAITELKVGEALVSVLDESGAPTPVERVAVRPPFSRVGPLTGDERAAVVAAGLLDAKYRTALDRDSAFEMLARKAAAAPVAPAAPVEAAPRARPAGRSIVEQVVASAARSMASSAGRQVANSLGKALLRGLFGGLRR